MSTVVILLSDKRSGSTMFQRELCQHPDIRHVEYSPHSHFETHHWLKAAVMLDMPPEMFADGKRYPGYGSVSNARTYLLDCIRENIPEYKVQHKDKELIFDSWEALCDRYAQPVFFEKSPQYLANWASLSLLLEWAQQTKHKAKFIGLTRNPMSVMYSAQQLFHTPPQKRQFSWLKTQRNLLAFQSIISPQDFLHLRYEEIIKDPIGSFTRIYEFIGVAPIENNEFSIHSESLEIWKTDPNFDFVLDDSVEQFALAFGYSTASLDNGSKTSANRSRSLLERANEKLKLSITRFNDRRLKPIFLRLKRW